MACYGYKTQGNNKPSSAEKQQEECSSFAALETKKKIERKREQAWVYRENEEKQLAALVKKETEKGER